MKNVLFLICALALFTAGFVSVAHAHAEKQSLDIQTELSMDQDNTDTNVLDPLCDMHGHNHIAPTDFVQSTALKSTNRLFIVISDSAVSSLIDGLKRPPRI